ncbi:hypothetical protein [uncultured Lactobacillus sp.]|uniref:hypothetical protein n=1 Tax=uncultured Lactobacillus sp. TaxID=153152 RepID=UPI002805F29A|nr:hypothetical protein [uncultured Lactobacillus sp.]
MISTYTNYTQQVYDKIAFLVNAVSNTFMDVDEQFNLKIPVLDNPGNKLNRSVYLWTIKLTRQLQSNLNLLVDVYNAHELIDEITDQDTDYLVLWLPERLVLDPLYYEQLNSNFKSANALLDRLLSYVKIYLN